MKPTLHAYSSEIATIKDFTKRISFSSPMVSDDKSSSITGNDINDKESIWIKRDSVVNILTNVNSRTMLVEPRMSIRNPDFNSLPTRGIRGSKNPGTKPIINSDTFSQTKTLIYADHKRTPNNSPKRKFSGSKTNKFPTDSIDSLNSCTDPEIAAALDQIACKMGLSDEKVSEISADPIEFLLKTSSFSERLAISKSSPIMNYKNRPGQFSTDKRAPSLLKPDDKIPLPLPITPVLRKKESSFRKMIQKLSPKGLRRTKSSPPIILDNSDCQEIIVEESVLEKKSNGQVNCAPYVKSPKNDHLTEPILYPDDEKIKDIYNISDQSKRVLHSISIDRIEDTKAMFLQKSKNRLNKNLLPCSDGPYSKSLSKVTDSLKGEMNTLETQLQTDLSFRNSEPIIPSSNNLLKSQLHQYITVCVWICAEPIYSSFTDQYSR